MVDDIRPQGAGAPPDEHKNTPKPLEAPNPQSTSPPVRPYAAQLGQTGEEGLVVLPSGKSIRVNPFKKIGAWFHGLSKRQKILASSLAAVLILVMGGGVYALTMRSDPPPPVAPAVVVEKKEEPPKPTTEASTLTGMTVPIGSNARPITSIQIENSPDARPQSALLEAGVVFEAIAEGGITRFNASFQEAKPDYIGPIRSVRPYYAELAAQFDPIFVHAGGSGDGLAKIQELGLKDLDHGPNAKAFQRVSDRYAPHNLYSSTAALDQVAAERGYTTSNAKGFARKAEKPGQAVTARSIDLTISSYLYNVNFTYDAASNSYLRTMAGKPHTDQRSGKQLSPKVVIGMVTSYSQNGIYSVYQTIGNGPVFIFQDGQVEQGTWEKAAAREPLIFKDGNGKVIAINPGQTWITLVKDPGQVVFAP